MSVPAFGMDSENRAHNASRVAMIAAYLVTAPSAAVTTTLPLAVTSTLPLSILSTTVIVPILIAVTSGTVTYGLWKAGESIYSGYTKSANTQQ